MEDGRYALTEFRLGPSGIEEGTEHLNEIERLVGVRNRNGKQVPPPTRRASRWW